MMEIEPVRVYHSEDQPQQAMSRTQANRWVEQQMSADDGPSDYTVRMYSQMRLSADEVNVARQLGISEDRLRTAKARELLSAETRR